jgi:hypothetical protein
MESVESKLNHRLFEERFNLIYRSLNCSSLLHEPKSKTHAIKIMVKTLFIYEALKYELIGLTLLDKNMLHNTSKKYNDNANFYNSHT